LQFFQKTALGFKMNFFVVSKLKLCVEC